ncbi:hypothetical protein D3C76_1279350 [compost metagenome]
MMIKIGSVIFLKIMDCVLLFSLGLIPLRFVPFDFPFQDLILGEIIKAENRNHHPHLAIGYVHEHNQPQIGEGHLPSFCGQSSKRTQNKQQNGQKPQQRADPRNGRMHIA